MCESGRPAHASSQPSVATSSAPGGNDVGQAELEHRSRVVRDAAVALARVGVGDPDGEHGTPAERAGDVGSVGERERAVAEPAIPCRRSPGPTAQTTAS